MNDSFLAYIQKLEAMSFFSGYALIYTVILFVFGNRWLKGKLSNQIVSFLPISYALISILFLGFQLKKLYPDYSFEHVRLTIQQPLLTIWGFLAMAFLIPAFQKRPFLSLIHSCLFFYFLASDLFSRLTTPAGDDSIVKNDMKVFAASIVLNLAALIFLVSLFLLYNYYKKHRSLIIKKLGNSSIILSRFPGKKRT